MTVNDNGNEKTNDGEQENEVSGLITLKAYKGNIVTKWQFPPNKKTCPVARCRKIFDTRSDAINHYTIHHSMNAIACFICDRPLCANRPSDYIRHFKHMHPNVSDPFDFAKQRDHPKLSTDLITLSGCGYKTQWRMPFNQTKCPVMGCRYISFESRLALILHYKEVHSKNSIYCCICEKPIVSLGRRDFTGHYKRIHPNVLHPFDFDANKKLPKIRQQKKVMFTLLVYFIYI